VRFRLPSTEVEMVFILRNGIVGLKGFIHVDQQVMVAAIGKIIPGMGSHPCCGVRSGTRMDF
jgi:hypothetical protein